MNFGILKNTRAQLLWIAHIRPSLYWMPSSDYVLSVALCVLNAQSPTATVSIYISTVLGCSRRNKRKYKVSPKDRLTLTDLHNVIFNKTGPTSASLWQTKMSDEPSVCMKAAVYYVVESKRSTSVVLFIYLWFIRVRRDAEPAEIRDRNGNGYRLSRTIRSLVLWKVYKLRYLHKCQNLSIVVTDMWSAASHSVTHAN